LQVLNSTAARDIETLVHPYTNLDRHRETGPRVVVRGEGIRVQDDQGRWYLEGMAGLWCASLGFVEPRIAEVAHKQLLKLGTYHVFNGASNEPAIDLSERLLALAPAHLTKVLYANSGSEANDTAIKLIWYYNNSRGRTAKKKLVGRFRGYHGVTVAAASLTGQPINHQDWDLPLPGFLHTDCPSFYHYAEAGETEDQFATRLAVNLEALIQREGPDTIAAFFAEPVNGGGGVIVPPPTYFAKIQEVLRRHDILFVADEVICGFGRTGNMFACETFDLKPDMLTCAKALSGSFLPISAVLMSEPIFEALVEQSKKLGVLGHGVTYSAHPVCAAVANEVLKIYQERDIVGHVRRVGPRLQSGLRQLAADHPLLGNARGVGLMGAVELSRDKSAAGAFDPSVGAGALVQQLAYDRGLIVRGMRGDGIAVCPPLIITEAEIDELLGLLTDALDATALELRRRGAWT
jgi:4-aminobutyrate---pyruvate transaminase